MLDNALTTRCELKQVGWSSILVAAALLNSAVIIEAQQPGKIPWVGYLAGSGSSPNQAFVQGMRDLGYIEGKNIGFVYRTTEGKRESYADFVT